jgi:hypothetical protein
MVQKVLAEEQNVGVPLLLLVLVWNTNGSQTLLRELEIHDILSQFGLDSETTSLREVFSVTIHCLVNRHLEVSSRKGKSEWIDFDGDAVRLIDNRQVGVNFHSFRFPQLQSLLRDLKSNPKELLNA